MKPMSAACLSLLLCTFAAQAQNGLSAPYPVVQRQWAKPPVGEGWGASAGIERGPRGEIWAIDRCGANGCDGSDRNPIVLLDPDSGQPIRSIGAGLFVFPHGLHVDRAGNIWVTDGAVSKDSTKGLQVMKLSPTGEVLLRLGTAGQRGDDGAHFQSPSDVITAPNGDLFVADRSNNRIQIFDQAGKFIAAWKQFGRPSGFYIAGDRLHAIDADSSPANHPGEWKKGVWIGSISRGLPDAFVPDDQAGEGVVVAPNGNMYGAVNVAPRGITRYLSK